MSKGKNNSFSLYKIKSAFILKQIFGKLDFNKFLNIIRYNKKYQEKLNISNNTYKEEQNKIELEIIPLNTPFIFLMNNSINKLYKSNFHFYLNDKKAELKRNYITSADNAKKVRLILDKEIKSLNGLFKDCINIKKIKFVKFNRDDIDDMSYMFYGCTSLEEISFTKIKTCKVKNLEKML